MSQNKVIGKDNKIPWHIPEDMKYFREKTKGHAIIMGRKTFESIGKPLPNRTNIIVTRQKNYQADGCIVTHTIEEALTEGKKHEQEEIFIAGGSEIYKESITSADRIYLTIIRKDFEGDTFFPDYFQFTKTLSQKSGKNDEVAYDFLVLEK